MICALALALALVVYPDGFAAQSRTQGRAQKFLLSFLGCPAHCAIAKPRKRTTCAAAHAKVPQTLAF
jgi:hypothetical protein